MTLLADVSSDAEAAGRFIGAGAVLLGGLAWILALSKRLGRPEYNRKCLWSFILTLGIWMLGGLSSFVKDVGGPTSVYTTFGVVMPLIDIVAIVLAVQGWFEVGKLPAESRPRGRGYAVATGVVGLFVLGAFAVGLKIGMDRSRLRTDEVAAVQPSPGETLRFEAQNFRLDMPSGRWTRLEPKSVNPIACLALSNRGLDSYLAVVAERQPAHAPVRLPALVEVVKSRVRSRDSAGSVLDERPYALGGLEGMLVETEFRVDDLTLASSTWCHTGPEHLYQIVYWGHRKDWPKLRRDRDAVFASFALLRKPVAPETAAQPEAPPLRDEGRNFAFRVPPKPWATLDPAKLEGDACLAWHQAPLNAFFMLVHEKLEDGDEASVEALAEVVRARLVSGSDSADVGKPQARRVGGLQGLQIDADLVLGAQTLSYRIWLHSRKGHQYQLFTWGLRGRRDEVRREADLFFRRFSVLDPTEDEEPDDF